MRLLFDPQVFSLGYSGMYRYYSSLYKGLTEAGVDIVYPQKNLLEREPGQQTFFQSNLHPRLRRLGQRLMYYRFRRNYLKALEKNNFDLLYITAPNFETDFLQHLNGRPFVMTVHDTMEAIGGNYTFLDQPRNSTSLGYLAHRAERVICISNYTKEDLCKKYLVNRKKTDTVYLANFLGSKTEDVENLPDKYILFVGSRNGRKNFFEWIKAAAPLLSRHPDLHLAVTGPYTESELFFSRKLGIENNLLSFENVTDAQLVTLYRNAVCLVYPSLYEGFGLPVLEAMANGCPVITSDRTSIPEVAGSAAILIDPLDPTMMHASLENVLHNPDIREKLAKKGLEQSKKFSQDKYIQEMIDVFSNALYTAKVKK